MSDIDEVKNRLNIVDIIGEKVTLKKAGRHFKGLCPFHNEKTPSFMVSPERQSFHCFGCGKGGSVIDFVMEYTHVDFSEALEELAARAGVTLTRRVGESAEAKRKEKIYEVNHLASEYYHYMLTKHRHGEKALLYLKNRGISDKSMQTFALGYSPQSWESLSTYLIKKGYDGGLLDAAGLVVRGSRGWYDRFRGRVMFSLKDHRGRVVGFAGRVLDPKVKEAKYINTQETIVYSKSNVLYGLDVTREAIVKADEAVVMEGEIDVISSFQAGIGNVVAIKGSALTEGHVALLKRYCQKIVFALDSDIAGQEAARRGIAVADEGGLDMRVAVLPKGKDPDEAARDDPSGLKKAIKNALPIYDYLISSTTKRFDLTSAFGKRQASEELTPMLLAIQNPIVQSHYIKKVGRTLDVSEETVIQAMKQKRSLAHDLTKKSENTEKKEAMTHTEKLERYLLTLLLQGETYTQLLDLREKKLQFELAGIERIVGALETYRASHEQFAIADFAATLSKELLAILDEAYLTDVASILDDPQKYQKEWTETLRTYQKARLRDKIKEITRKLAAEESEDLQKELQDATEQLSSL